MNTTNLVEVCCCERQLPAIIKGGTGDKVGGRTAAFFTMGDVTLGHLFKAVSYMAGATHRMLLVTAEPTEKTMRWIKTWMQRGWTTEVAITARQDVTALVATELEWMTDKVTVAKDETLQTELVAMEGERGTVVVCGPMLTVARPGLTVYAAYSGSCRGTMAELLSAAEARHRGHRVEPAMQSQETDEDKGETPVVTKTKTKTKKAKKNGNTEEVEGTQGAEA